MGKNISLFRNHARQRSIVDAFLRSGNAGGTANVTVIISDERISSPVLNSFDSAIILNQQSVDKFEPLVKPGGTLLYDPNGTPILPPGKTSTSTGLKEPGSRQKAVIPKHSI